MAPALDLFSKLPDDLLCFIISYLPIKEAVRSSVLSRRWRYLYHQLPELTLSPDLVMGEVIPNPLAIAQVENIICNILLLHSSDIKIFDLYTRNDWHFTSENLCKWVHCVASKNVEDLSLRHLPAFGPLQPREILPCSLFLCNRLRRLVLFDHIVSKIPTSFGGFNRLIYCFFRNVEFREDTLTLFLSHCPLLETLELYCGVVPQNITISARHIESLTLHVNNPVEILTVNCPKLRDLRLSRIKDLRVNGLLFQGLSSVVRSLTFQCGSTMIEEMSLDPSSDETVNLSAERWAEIMGKFKSLKELYIYNQWEDKIDIPSTKLLQGLPHLERLDISGTICLSLTKDSIPTSLDSPLLSVREVYARCESNYDEKEIDVLVWLLGNSPALETMQVTIPPPLEAGKDENYIQLLRRILDSNFRRPSPPARVCVREDPFL